MRVPPLFLGPGRGEADVTLIVGLGNPGPEYARTRHNVGFRVLDLLAARRGLAFGPEQHGCAVAGDPAGTLLVKPQLYMNRSGEALRAWAEATGFALPKLGPAPGPQIDGGEAGDLGGEPGSPGGGADLLAVGDDIALPLGALRLRAGGSDGGHRGLESLIRVLGAGDFPRLRLGVAPAGGVPAEAWSDFVLGMFLDEEWPVSEELVSDAADAVEAFLAEGCEAAAGRFNRRRALDPDPPPGPPPGTDRTPGVA